MGLGFEGRKTLPSLLLSLARSRRAAGRGATMGWQGGWVGGLQGGEVMWQRRRKTTCSLASAPPSHVSRHVASKAFSQLDLEQSTSPTPQTIAQLSPHSEFHFGFEAIAKCRSKAFSQLKAQRMIPRTNACSSVSNPFRPSRKASKALVN